MVRELIIMYDHLLFLKRKKKQWNLNLDGSFINLYDCTMCLDIYSLSLQAQLTIIMLNQKIMKNRYINFLLTFLVGFLFPCCDKEDVDLTPQVIYATDEERQQVRELLVCGEVMYDEGEKMWLITQMYDCDPGPETEKVYLEPEQDAYEGWLGKLVAAWGTGTLYKTIIYPENGAITRYYLMKVEGYEVQETFE